MYRNVVPPYVSSIEKPLRTQSLINPTSSVTNTSTSDDSDIVDNKEDELIKADVNKILDSNEKIKSHIKAWKRTISGFG